MLTCWPRCASIIKSSCSKIHPSPEITANSAITSKGRNIPWGIDWDPGSTASFQSPLPLPSGVKIQTVEWCLGWVDERSVAAKTGYHISPLIEPQSLIALWAENQRQARFCPIFRKIKLSRSTLHLGVPSFFSLTGHAGLKKYRTHKNFYG